ncbi:phage major capsid protein [Amycolatopsis sp. NPDC051128]|uniref:phage major capsid protein n=1 Tax=Amycolatopsis sp. NPDC051128 TaxID=3155412 RepID=UPI00342E9125
MSKTLAPEAKETKARDTTTDAELSTVDEFMAAMDELIASADAEGRNLTDEEIGRYEQLETRMKGLQRHDEIAKRHAAYKMDVTAPLVNVTTAKTDDTLDRAFNHYLRTGKENDDLVELRAQSEGTGSEGGYLVPEGFRNKLVERIKAFGGIANAVENLETTDGRNLPWPTVDDTGNVGEVVDEGGTFTSGADIVFGTAGLGAYSYMAGGGSSLPLRVSLELIQDAAFDVEGLVSRKLGERIARMQATHLVTGTGVKQPLGIATGLTGIELLADTAGVTYDDLINFIHSVDPAYRANARWAFNDTSLATIEKIKDSHGDPIFRPADANMGTSAQGGSVGVLLNYPVTIDQAFPNISAADNTVNWGVFGDLVEGYVRRTVKQYEVLVNPYNRMSNRQVEYTAWARMDATQQNTNAYVALTGEA